MIWKKRRKTGLPEDAQAAKDLDSKCARFEKKLHDLETYQNDLTADSTTDPPCPE